MDKIVDPIGYILDKVDIPKRIFDFIEEKIFLNKLLISQEKYESRHTSNAHWIETKHGFKYSLYLPNIYDKYNNRIPKITILSSDLNVLSSLFLLIKVNSSNEIIQKPINVYDIGNKPISVNLCEIPYRYIVIKNNNFIFSYNDLEIYMVMDKEKILLNVLTPTNYELLNSQYIYKFGYYWNTQFIDYEMEEMFCKDQNKIIDRSIFKIICSKKHNPISYKLIRMLYWIKTSKK
jgi:hypothetical protein